MTKNNVSIITSEALKDEVNQQWFDQEYWINQGRLLGANSGRGSTWVVKTDWGKWVLRHYYRGGLYAKLNRDRYLWTGLTHTRAYQEYQLLDRIQKLGLPSPKPVAALVVKRGLFYRNDLIMEHIQHQYTFAQALILSSDANNDDPEVLTLSTWHMIGQTIAQYHKNGLFHSDLNAHNILLNNATNIASNNAFNKTPDNAQVFIIDFDKGKIKKPHQSWQQNNMNRLKRSIEKVTNESCDQQLSSQWQQLLEGYDAS